MSRRIKAQADHYYHINNRGVERRPIFLDRQDYGFFKARLKKYATECEVSVLAYCCMPNHYHLLIHAMKEDSLSKMLHRLQTSYAGYFNKRYSHSGYVFQGRYNGKEIRSTTYLAWLLCYIHLNPVDAGLVRHAEQWQYSDYSQYQKEPNPMVIKKLLDLTYADIMNEYLARRQEKEDLIREYFLD
jgi:REP element-mobilizing transposase RayT